MTPTSDNARQNRLLVVDDDESSRDMLWRWLTRKGYGVECACSGVEALEKQQYAGFDLILLDNMMPGMSGLEVLTRLRTTFPEAELPVIMVTAQSGTENVAQALRLGASDFLVKPLEISVVMNRIEAHLARRRLAANTMRARATIRGGLESADKGTWDWHVTTGRIHFSREWKAMLGYAESEIQTDPEEWFRRVHQDDQQRLREELSAHLAGSSAEFTCDYRIRHRDGRICQMRCSALTTRDSMGAARRLTGAQLDLSRIT